VTSPPRAIERFEVREEMDARAAGLVSEAAAAAVAGRGVFHLVLAGGSTHLSLYSLLASPPWRELLPWSATHLYWSDERCVPPDDPASNYRAAREALLDRIGMPPAQVHRIPAEEGPGIGAARYEATLRALFPRLPFPPFDLVLLGVGSDGHTASLFFGDEALREKDLWVAPVAREWGSPLLTRVTLTLPALCAARAALFLAESRGKERVLRALFAGESGSPRLPAARVSPAGGPARWLVLSP
jgi:6-phosphogluconolactonase